MANMVQVICENYVPTSFNIAGEHGFAAIVTIGDKSVVFDTGQGIGFIGNCRMLGAHPEAAEALALSHGHKDHTGGLLDFLDMYGGKTVIGHPSMFDPKVAKRKLGDKEIQISIGIPWPREELEEAGAVFKLVSEPLEIIPGVWFSGEVPTRNDFEVGDPGLCVGSGEDVKVDPFQDDAALYILTEQGISIVAGCAHRGIVNTMDHAREVLGDKPFNTVIGGFHLMDSGDERVEKTIEAFKKNDVGIVATGHCTGLPAGMKIAAALGERHQFMWAGRTFAV